MILLKTDKVTKRFGALTAVNDVSIEVEAGERRAIIGPNGAGKSTLFHMICGRFPANSGSIKYMDREIGGLLPHQIARLGISRSFQITNIFPALPVRENFRLAVQASRHQSAALSNTRPSTARDVLSRTEDLLSTMGLAGQADTLAAALSYGDQRRIEIGLALASRPTLVFFDEPTAGMARGASQEIIELLRAIPRETTIVLIDHDLDVVFALSDRITVMRNGSVLAEGTPSEIEQDERVQEAYFGGLVQDAGIAA